jgi:branched-chain amino acid transport system substrate-binding protein
MAQLNLKRTSYWSGAVAALVILLLVVAGIAWEKGYFRSSSGNPSYKMAAILPLTGNSAAIGTPKKEAIELAVTEISRLYPVLDLKITFGDSLGTPRDGVAAFSKAVSTDHAHLAYVDMTTIVNATLPLLDSNRVYTLAGSAEAGITERSPYLFRVFPGGNQEISLITDYLTGFDPAPTVFLIHTNEQYGRSVNELLTTRLKDTKVRMLGSEEYSLADSDFRAQLTKARESQADLVVLLGYGIRYPQILKQAQELGIAPGRFVSNLGAVNAPVIALPPELTNGMVFAGPAFNLRMKHLDDFPTQRAMVEAYRSRYGKDPDFRVAFVYDSMIMLADALVRAGSLESLPRALIGQIYHGASGRIEMGTNRDALVDMVLARYDHGEIVVLKPSE